MDIMTDPHLDEDLHGFANCRWLHELRWLTFAVSFTGNIYESTRFCCAAPFWKVGSPRAIFSPRHLLGNPLPDIIWKCIIPCRQICKFSKSLPFLGISCPSLFRIRRKKVGMLGRCWASLPWSPPLQLLPNNSMLPSTSGSAPGNQVFFQVVKFQAPRWDFKRPTKKIKDDGGPGYPIAIDMSRSVGWWYVDYMIQWIGLRENLNRKPSIFPSTRSWGLNRFHFSQQNQSIESYNQHIINI